MRLYNSYQLIQRLEKDYIYNYVRADRYPRLAIILSTQDNTKKTHMMLDAVTETAQKYNVIPETRYCHDPIEGVLAAQEFRMDQGNNGIIMIGSFGKKEDKAIADSIPTRLDVNCVNSDSLGHMIFNDDEKSFRSGPCASIACYEVIKDIYGTNKYAGKKMAILSRSLNLGLPLAEILVQRDATTTVYHSKSYENMFEGYDVVVSAVGKPNIWKMPHVAPLWGENRIVIDAGINEFEDSIVGDIDYTNHEEYPGVLVPTGEIYDISNVVLMSKVYINFALAHGEIV